jgi:hypothetical protein
MMTGGRRLKHVTMSLRHRWGGLVKGRTTSLSGVMRIFGALSCANTYLQGAKLSCSYRTRKSKIKVLINDAEML